MMYTELYSFEGTAATRKHIGKGQTRFPENAAEAPQRARGYWEYPSESEARCSKKREITS